LTSVKQAPIWQRRRFDAAPCHFFHNAFPRPLERIEFATDTSRKLLASCNLATAPRRASAAKIIAAIPMSKNASGVIVDFTLIK
jgi:hypothetical protein